MRESSTRIINAAKVATLSILILLLLVLGGCIYDRSDNTKDNKEEQFIISAISSSGDRLLLISGEEFANTLEYDVDWDPDMETFAILDGNLNVAYSP